MTSGEIFSVIVVTIALIGSASMYIKACIDEKKAKAEAEKEK